MSKKFITPSELAERWMLSTQTIYNRISCGEPMPRSIRIGNTRRFSINDIEAFEGEHLEVTTLGAPS